MLLIQFIRKSSLVSKKIIFLLIFYKLCSYSCSENNREFNKSEYNGLISLAENQILNKQLPEANLTFKKVYKESSKFFSFDLNNALIVALNVKDWDVALSYSLELVKRGCDLNFFERDIFNDFRQRPQWGILEIEYKDLRNNYLKEVNEVLIDSLNILQNIDQNQYCLIPSGRIELENALARTVFIDSLLVKLIENRGFPSEKLIGANIKRDTFISPLPSFYGLLRHSYQANSDLLKKYIQNAVNNGDLKQEAYDKISGIDNMQYVVIDCKIYKDKFNTSDSLKDVLFEKKIIYNNSRSYEGYYFYAPLAILNQTTKENFGGGHFDTMYEYIADYSNCIK